MGSLAILKSGLVGGLGFIVALGAVIALLTFAADSSKTTLVKARKAKSFIVLLIVWATGWGISYWYLSGVSDGNQKPDETVLTLFACLLTLTPSIAIVCSSFTYYIDVLKMVNAQKGEDA